MSVCSFAALTVAFKSEKNKQTNKKHEKNTGKIAFQKEHGYARHAGTHTSIHLF